MTNRIKAIGRAALVRAHVTGIERRLQEGLEDAQEVGLPNVVDKIIVAQDAVSAAHEALNAVAHALAAAFNDEPSTFSGGDDKPELP